MQPKGFLVRLRWYTETGVTLQIMDSRGLSLGQGSLRRALAVLACAALLYFVTGAIFLHEHTSGDETVCPVCQALHMPALAVTPVDLTYVVQQAVWDAVVSQPAIALESLTLHPAPRAPPTV
jgi:hypothetical protein